VQGFCFFRSHAGGFAVRHNDEERKDQEQGETQQQALADGHGNTSVCHSGLPCSSLRCKKNSRAAGNIDISAARLSL
jgi:hypothetical protein